MPGERIDVLTTGRHYVDHVAPVWHALPADRRGDFITRTPEAKQRARALGITPTARLEASNNPTIILGGVDYTRAVTHGRHHTIWLSHGVGQPYRGANGELLPTGEGYAPKMPEVRLWLVPGPIAAGMVTESSPGANVVQVGSPRIDYLRATFPTPTEPLIVFSGRWPHRIAPESAPATWRYYLGAIKAASVDMPVALHAHPRIAQEGRRYARLLNLPFIPEFDEVCRRATLYSTDNSSTVYEFAALDRPVVLLNAPTYRRDHEHGLRFWEAAGVGMQVDEPDDLVPTLRHAIKDPKRQQAARRQALAMAYLPFDGQAANRAAAAILAHTDA